MMKRTIGKFNINYFYRLTDVSAMGRGYIFYIDKCFDSHCTYLSNLIEMNGVLNHLCAHI